MAKPREHNYLEYRNRIGRRHVCIFTVRTQICTFSSQIRNLTIHSQKTYMSVSYSSFNFIECFYKEAIKKRIKICIELEETA